MKIRLKDNYTAVVDNASTNRLIIADEFDTSKLTADNMTHIEFITDNEQKVYGIFDLAQPDFKIADKTYFYKGDIVPCKHYIHVEGTYIADGFSDAYRAASEDDIMITEAGGREFVLLGEENPQLYDQNGCHLYRYENGAARLSTAEELAEESASMPEPEVPEQPTDITARVASLEADIMPISRAAMFSAMSFTDEQAIQVKSLYPEWEIGKAYAAEEILRYGVDENGSAQLYRISQAHTSQADWTPDKTPSLYKAIGFTSSGVAIWIQPEGAHDAYKKGDTVSHKDKLWTSDVDGNVWEPGVYGWTEV